MCSALKAGDFATIQRMVNRVHTLYSAGFFETFFSEDTMLVPIPGSARIRNQSTPWIAERICNELTSVGLGAEVLPIAERRTTVAKSSYQKWGKRPSPKVHFDSIEVSREMVDYKRLLLVDDVVTKGSTILGVASRVSDAYPRSEVQAFAMIRTMGLQPDIESFNEPTDEGRITLRSSGDARRDP